MGHDEHGPAYPEPPQYRCPICHGGPWRYVECEYPGCPDGRDRGHPHAALRETYDGPAPLGAPIARTLVGIAIVIALALYMFWPRIGG